MFGRGGGVSVLADKENRAHRAPLHLRRSRCASVWVNKTSPFGKEPDRMQRGTTSPLSRETDAPETIVKLECDIDDASPEVLAYAADRLREAGAREVHWLPLYCKKGRPGWQLQVICTHEDIERLQTIIFLETTTNGIRRQVMERVCLARHFERVTTPWGEVSVKVATLPDGSERAAPEYEDCARLAREHNVPLQRVMQAAQSAALRFE